MTRVTHDYGKLRALDGLDLSIESGEVFGLLGNNGAGKTTTMRLLAGLHEPTSGQVRVLGQDPWTDRVPVMQRVGYFAETDAPYPWLKLRELFRAGELCHPTWSVDRCRELVERFDLDLERRVDKLSQGMVAKAKLVMALAHGADCLLLDEPTSGLDPGSRAELLEVIATASRRDGAATLLSSHDLGDVEAVAARIGILDRGRLRLTVRREELGTLALLRGGLEAPPGTEVLARRETADGVERLLREPCPGSEGVDLRGLFLFVTSRDATVGEAS